MPLPICVLPDLLDFRQFMPSARPADILQCTACIAIGRIIRAC